jgi:hypothetical protein
VVQEKGKCEDLGYQNLDSPKTSSYFRYQERFAKSLWKTFKAAPQSTAREEVSEEIKFASEQVEYESRQLQP